MQKGDKKIFIDKGKLLFLINLRRVGYSVSTLSLLFDADRASIRTQFEKYGIPEPDEKYMLADIVAFFTNSRNAPQRRYFLDSTGTKVNVGKTYKEYLAIEAKKQNIPVEQLTEYSRL